MDADLGELEEGFGERLDLAIKQRGLSVAELARESMLSRWTIMNWVQERTRPEMAGLRRLSRVLDVRAEDLLGQEAGDDTIDTVEKFFSWRSQQQYQEIVHLRHVIEAEVARRLADEQVARRRGRPRTDSDAAAVKLVREVKKRFKKRGGERPQARPSSDGASKS